MEYDVASWEEDVMCPLHFVNGDGPRGEIRALNSFMAFRDALLNYRHNKRGDKIRLQLFGKNCIHCQSSQNPTKMFGNKDRTKKEV